MKERTMIILLGLLLCLGSYALSIPQQQAVLHEQGDIVPRLPTLPPIPPIPPIIPNITLPNTTFPRLPTLPPILPCTVTCAILTKLIKDVAQLKKSQPFYGQIKNWITYTPQVGAYVDVTYADKGLTKTPKIFTSLYGVSLIWATTGATSIYGASKDGFRVYVKGLTVAQLNTVQAVLQYMVVPQQ